MSGGEVVEAAVPGRSLAQCEEVIQRGLGTFMEVGTALAEIRDRGLHKQAHGTFEEYCRQRWSLSRKRAYDLMGAAGAVAELSPIGDTSVVVNEGQARALARAVKQLGPEAAARVLERVAAEAAAEEQRLTARRIEEEAARRLAEAGEREARARQERQRQRLEQEQRDRTLAGAILPRLLADVILPRYQLTGVHPACALMPWTTPAELASLAASIKLHGLLLPVDALPDGTLLDGKRRLLGCWLADLERVPVRTVETGDPVQHSLSANLNRQHLAEDQRAFIAAGMADRMRAEPDLWAEYLADSAQLEQLAGEYRRRLESLHALGWAP